MPKIVPIRDLKDTMKISNLCHETDEPIFVTKNGYGDMVIMSMDTYEKKHYLQDVYAKIDEAEKDAAAGRYKPAKEATAELRQKYGL